MDVLSIRVLDPDDDDGPLWQEHMWRCRLTLYIELLSLHDTVFRSAICLGTKLNAP
jgi:hypothetical protein